MLGFRDFVGGDQSAFECFYNPAREVKDRAQPIYPVLPNIQAHSGCETPHSHFTVLTCDRRRDYFPILVIGVVTVVRGEKAERNK